MKMLLFTNLIVTMLLVLAAVMVAKAVPLLEDYGDKIYMPGDFPVLFEVGNGDARAISYHRVNSPPNVLSPGSLIRKPSPVLREVDGRQCGLSLGTIVFRGTCQRLLTQAICSEGEWLVKKKNADEGNCVPRPCPKGQLKYEGVCHDVSKMSTCNEGQMLYVDLTGSAYCDCRPNFFYDPWKGICFTQHDRGSCNFGKYLDFTKSGAVECIPNPCKMEGFTKHEPTGKCFRKMYRGGCESPYHRQFYPANMTVECIADNIRSIFDLPTMRSCGTGSIRDHARVCRDLFRVPTETTYPAVSFGECRVGFVKDPLGICRRVHKLFG